MAGLDGESRWRLVGGLTRLRLVALVNMLSSRRKHHSITSCRISEYAIESLEARLVALVNMLSSRRKHHSITSCRISEYAIESPEASLDHVLSH
jgi:hypothetical protein